MIVQKLSGLHIVSPPISVRNWVYTISVVTSPTKAPVMAPSIGARTPPLDTVPTAAPVPVANETIPAFLREVQPTARAGARMVSHKQRRVPALQPLLSRLLSESFDLML